MCIFIACLLIQKLINPADFNGWDPLTAQIFIAPWSQELWQ